VPAVKPAIYVPTVSIGAPDFTLAVLPSLNAITPVACAITPTTPILNNEIRADLDTTATYRFVVGLFGYDQPNQGYTIGKCSQPSAATTISAGQFIRLSIPNASWPVGFSGTKLAAVFMKKGAGDYQLCQLAYIDSANEFNTSIAAECFPVCPTRTLSFLQNASGDAVFGTMLPYPMQEEAVGTTTGGVNYDRSASTVTVSPDNTTDYNVVTARGCSLSFNLLASDVRDVVKATAGIDVKYTGNDGASYEDAQQTLITAAAILKGNRHIIVNETTSDGTPVIRILVGNLTTSQAAVTVSRTKTAVAQLAFNLQTASVDSLLNGLDSEIAYSRRA
jgi:hypothetical protein